MNAEAFTKSSGFPISRYSPDRYSWASFSDWQAKIPSVNYGIFTNEVDATITAQIPALVAGGSIDEAIAAIDAQVAAQIQ